MTFDPLAFQDPDANPWAPHDDTKCVHEGTYCPGCRKEGAQIDSVVMFAKEENTTPDAWVRAEEGTYNSYSQHFLCDDCFITEERRRGGRLRPVSGATRWICP
jgi:hypothetical protein